MFNGHVTITLRDSFDLLGLPSNNPILTKLSITTYKKLSATKLAVALLVIQIIQTVVILVQGMGLAELAVLACLFQSTFPMGSGPSNGLGLVVPFNWVITTPALIIRFLVVLLILDHLLSSREVISPIQINKSASTSTRTHFMFA
jgi:hypothetical protein